jgi:hypothetical protein
MTNENLQRNLRVLRRRLNDVLHRAHTARLRNLTLVERELHEKADTLRRRIHTMEVLGR